ncbi:protein of unknown function [Candidatus Hydrogenisulfobacillus filiaventi]|uniref:Uncharacterized protein n=1 Tax=Candidatus Hydrogenisulfobacillus filiaventi TaxID=2707344 RepID=A0A6F8ZFG3_9FIRM|nr:protein of unknown function [Candidatus Hydrogenisulfobacillus filiaventi]
MAGLRDRLWAAGFPDLVEGAGLDQAEDGVVRAVAVAGEDQPGLLALWGPPPPRGAVLGPAGRARALAAARAGTPAGPPLRVRPYRKLVTYVPAGYLEAVRQALGDAGAGHIGLYSHCTFAARGQGTFLPLAGANPFLGAVGRLEEADEWRLETLVPAWLADRVEAALLAAHPYEEVAYDWFELANEVRYPRALADGEGGWWTACLDPELAAAAVAAGARAVVCEHYAPEARWALARAGIPCRVEAPGAILLPGLERLVAQAAPGAGGGGRSRDGAGD